VRVLVAGATGVIGRQLIPMLAAGGHQVVAMARHHRAELITTCDMELVTADALDPSAVSAAVRAAAPDAVVNLLTAIPAGLNPKHMADQFLLTNRLRTEGTRSLLTAAAANGVRRVIAEGLAYAYDPDAPGPADEDQPLWRHPPRQFAPVLDALVEHEKRTRDAGGLVLRMGHLYGPGTIYAPDGYIVQQVRARKVPLVRRGNSVFSFTHVEDAATAVVAALDHESSEVLNVVDDAPAPITDWLPAFAALLGAPQPRRLPRLLVRLAAGDWGLAFLAGLRGADNTRARETLNWRPRFPNWRQGFEHELRSRTQAMSVDGTRDVTNSVTSL
jgi:nucleoside-diphosphate-sugar epimerase